MSDPFVAIGLAGLSLVVCVGTSEVYDAYKHRDHPSRDPRSELVEWSATAAAWAVITLAGLVA